MRKQFTIAFNLKDLLKKSEKIADYKNPIYVIMFIKRLYTCGHLIVIWSDKSVKETRKVLRKFDLLNYVHLIDDRSMPEIMPDIAFDSKDGVAGLATIKF